MQRSTRNHKRGIVVLILIPVLLLLIVILVGVNRTPRSYAPTISAMLSDYIDLTILYAFTVTCYTVIENFVSVAYINHEHEKNITGKLLLCLNKRYWIQNAPWFARVFMVLRNSMYALIAVVRVDEYPTIHYNVALLTVVFNQCMFHFQILRRSYYNGRWLWFQMAFYVFIWVSFIIFATVSFFNPTAANNLDWAIWEYTLYFCVVSTNAFWIFDVDVDTDCCSTHNFHYYSQVSVGSAVVVAAPEVVVPNSINEVSYIAAKRV